jgi:hypothetical protein
MIAGFGTALPEVILFAVPLGAGVDSLVPVLAALETGPTFPRPFIRRIAIHKRKWLQVNLIAHGPVEFHRLT